MFRFQLSGVAFDLLLKLISCFLPSGHRCVSSMYKVKKMCLEEFPDFRSTKHYYCLVCHGSQSMITDGKCQCGSTNIGRFLVSNIGIQLQQKFGDPMFWKGVQSRPGSSSVVIRDVYDGAEYRKYSQRGQFLCKETNPANVSFLFNTDGVALFRSASTEIWPVYFAINELPPQIRFCKKYMILGGLWYGKDKPLMLTYLKPLMKQVNALYENGKLFHCLTAIEVKTADGKALISRCVLLQSSLDMPARSAVTNMKLFNGKYSCSTCEDPGDNVQSGHPLHRVWPYTPINITRTSAYVYQSVALSIQKNEAVMGYKGFPALAEHRPFNVVKGVVIDCLHCVLLGMSTMLLNTWLNTSNAQKPFYLGREAVVINGRLMKIKVPDVIKRPPRTLEDRKHWKGTEWQNWLLFYSLPILDGLLPGPYFLHYCAFVCGISIRGT